MEEFFVEFEFKFPVEWTPEQREELRKQEAKASNDHWDEGVILRLWRVPGRTAAIGIWRAENVTALHAVLRSLPYAQAGIADFKVMSLADHPTELEARRRAADGVEGAQRHPW